jgi:hypothetical protein
MPKILVEILFVTERDVDFTISEESIGSFFVEETTTVREIRIQEDVLTDHHQRQEHMINQKPNGFYRTEIRNN